MGLRAPIAVSLVGKAAEAVTLVLLSTVVPRTLGPTDYGRFAVALTAVAIGAVALTLGGATTLARYVPAAPVPQRAALARDLTLRLARNRVRVLAGLAAVAGAAVALDPARFDPVHTVLVLAALALNVATTLVLQAGLGLGRATAWSLRYPLQNAVLIVSVLLLYRVHQVTGAVVSVVVAALAATGLGLVAAAPLRRADSVPVPLPDGALRFGLLQAVGGALMQVIQRGAVLVVAWQTGAGPQAGYAALAIGVALALTYAVAQVFTVSLPTLTTREPAEAEALLRRLTGMVLAFAGPAMLLAVLLRDLGLPLAFGADYAGSAAAFGPAFALVVLAPAGALTVQAAALRLRPEVLFKAGLAGAVTFVLAAVTAVPHWGAAGGTFAALAGTVVATAVQIRLVPGAVGARLTAATFGGAALVAGMGVLG